MNLNKIVFRIFAYGFFPVLIWAFCLNAAFWWSNAWSPGVSPKRAFGAVALLLLAMASAYDRGYKKWFKYGEKKYFYFVYVLPIVLGVIGFLYGVFRMQSAS